MNSPAAGLVLYNANVLTLDPERPGAELVAVGAGEIIGVGLDNDLEDLKGQARLINCEGKTVVPGFNDAHAHIFACVLSLLNIDCSPESVKSVSEIQGKIKREAARVPQGTWLRAGGYNEFYLAERRHPTRRDLDLVAPNHPVKLTHRSMHACVLNSQALSLAGITIETPDPQGGLIDRELDTGEPSGLLYGMNSYINEHVVPPLSDDELRKGVGLAGRSFLSSGITSIQDATVRNGFEQWQSFRRLKERGEFAPRINMMLGIHALASFKDRGMHAGYGGNSLRLGAVKIALDEVKGQLNPSQEELDEAVLTAHRDGFQVAMHAVEEGTVEAAIAALESCLRRQPKADHRHRVEHCSVCPPELLQRLKAVNAVVVTQPAFIYYSGERYLQDVSPAQLPWLYRTRSFLESGLRPAGSSDFPVAPCEPLTGIYAAVTRKAGNGQVLSAEEAISPEEALRLYTSSGAYASFEERSKGSIAVGKMADMVVLSADPTKVEPGDIKEIRVKMTIIGGEVVWEE